MANSLNSYGLFKAMDKKLLDSEDLSNRLSTAEKIARE
jgi:nucleolar protein 58